MLTVWLNKKRTSIIENMSSMHTCELEIWLAHAVIVIALKLYRPDMHRGMYFILALLNFEGLSIRRSTHLWHTLYMIVERLVLVFMDFLDCLWLYYSASIFIWEHMARAEWLGFFTEYEDSRRTFPSRELGLWRSNPTAVYCGGQTSHSMLSLCATLHGYLAEQTIKTQLGILSVGAEHWGVSFMTKDFQWSVEYEYRFQTWKFEGSVFKASSACFNGSMWPGG